MGITIDTVLSRLEHVKKTGTNQWKASCPCAGHKHEDKTQSLTVHLNADGKIDVFCHVGHTLEEICEAMQIKTTDLLPAQQDKTSADKKRNLIQWYAGQNNLTYVCEYSYCYGTYDDGLCKLKFLDGSGEKTFRWIKKDDSKKSGYAFSHDGCDNRLYIAGDPDADVVYLCEGEKDADTVHYLTGCTAASAEHGATGKEDGKKWFDEYTRQLTNKTVYILYDNDDVGRAWARIEVQKLSDKSKVHVLNLPVFWSKCPEKGDVSDALKVLGADQTKAIIEALRENATDTVPAEKAEEKEDPFIKFCRDIQTKKYQPVKTGMDELDELLGGGILRQSLVILLAAPSAGKTTFAQQLLETMAEHQHHAIFMNLEMSREQLYARSISRIMRNLGHNMSASGILKGYSWTQEQKRYVIEASEHYMKYIHKYLQYNPDGMTTDIDVIRSILEQAGEEARAHDPEASGPIIALDYLHLVSSAQRIDGSEIIKQTVAALKEYAVKYNTIVLLISASNRTSNASGKQTMESARDTSSVEYSADFLLGLTYREFDEWNGKEKEKPKLEELQQQSPRKMTLKLMKNRLDGSGKKIYLDFDASTSTFTYAGKPEKAGYTKVKIDADKIFKEEYDNAINEEFNYEDAEDI